MTETRAWILKQRPKARVTRDELDVEARPLPEPGDGEILVETLYLSLDPANRTWMNEADTYVPAAKLDEPMKGLALMRVLKSRVEKFSPGDLVTGMGRWAERAVLRGKDVGPFPIPEGAEPATYFGLMSMIGPTAYFGLMDVGRPKAGETVTVTAAAGAVGSVVGQIAKIQGCRVVGVAGSDEKCEKLLNLGYDAAVNYKTEKVAKAFAQHCPDGIDVHFENVSAEMLEAGLAHINTFGRVVLCGMISQYNEPVPPPGPRNLATMIIKRVRMQGFVVTDYLERYPEAGRKLAEWVQAGRLRFDVDVSQGLESVLDQFQKLYDGTNTGKVLVKVAS